MSTSTINRRQRVIDYKSSQFQIPVAGTNTLKSILSIISVILSKSNLEKVFVLVLTFFFIFCSFVAFDQTPKNQALQDQSYCKILVNQSKPTCN